MSERKIHFAGSPVALVGYPYSPCGARLIPADDIDEANVTCKRCRDWAIRYHERRIAEQGADRTIRHEDHEFAPGECDGSGTCSAPIHVHGCYTPHRSDECDSPEEYGHTDSTDGSER